MYKITTNVLGKVTAHTCTCLEFCVFFFNYFNIISRVADQPIGARMDLHCTDKTGFTRQRYMMVQLHEQGTNQFPIHCLHPFQ